MDVQETRNTAGSYIQFLLQEIYWNPGSIENDSEGN
jgi:hypothetical protein